MKHLLHSALLLILLPCAAVYGQTTTSIAHSHNDYMRSVPFYKAYSLGVGSIEPDIMLVDGELMICQ